MKKHIALFSLVAAALVATPIVTQAEDKAPAATESKPKHADATPYHGKVTAVDASASTITLGELTLSVSATTKFSKDGKPAKLEDFAAGEDVRGSYKTGTDGKKTAVSVRTGGKAPKGGAKKKKSE